MKRLLSFLFSILFIQQPWMRLWAQTKPMCSPEIRGELPGIKQKALFSEIFTQAGQVALENGKCVPVVLWRDNLWEIDKRNFPFPV